MTESNTPHWKRLYVQSQLPEQLLALEKIANNLWWSWNYEAETLFQGIHPELWETLEHNPIALLDNLSQSDYRKLIKDSAFMEQLAAVEEQFDAYMAEGEQKSGPHISYFCMEYGLHASFKLYSGGLGVLAGDFLKEASDENIDMVGMGLLYRYGYFRQGLSHHGEQVAYYDPQRFTYLPIEPVRNEEGGWIKIAVNLPERIVHAKVWKANVGRIALYLLDTDLEENREDDRFITHQLYGGDRENRLKQEILLGIGGIRALEAVGRQSDIYHLNEGHAAFIGMERLRRYMQYDKLSFSEAKEVIRGSSLFTTHTPVPAGHDGFSEGMMWPYFSGYVEGMGISWQEFMELGRVQADHHEEFSMSYLATRLSLEVNGVSKIHGEVSRDMFLRLYPGFEAQELHITHVTNSIHYPTWTAPDFQQLYLKTFGKNFLKNQSDTTLWEKIYQIEDRLLMDTKKQQKRILIDFLKERLAKNMRARHESPQKIAQTLNMFDENALMVGFARRFATYKRAQLLFTNLERLSRVVNNPERPVQFLFAGKAHPADQGGQNLIKRIIEVSGQPEFLGKVIFIEDYDMDIASVMVKGVDVWLNTPTRPLEASGTSGMKATMNGGMNFSVLDGWWAEGYDPEAGWALPEDRAYESQEVQNELDAITLYEMLESDIVPTFYAQDDQGISAQWVTRMKHTIARIAPQFTMKRMMDDYHEKFYHKLNQRHGELRENNYEKAKALSAWKSQISHAWSGVHVVEKNVYNFANDPLPLGENFKAEIVLDIQALVPEDVGVELLIAKQHRGAHEIVMIEPLKKEEVALTENGGEKKRLVKYTYDEEMTFSGVYDYGFRIFAQNDLLGHRQDFSEVKWL